MKITNQLPEDINYRYTQYLSLTHTERWIFSVLSVIYKPISLGNLNKLLKQLDEQLFDNQIYHYERISSGQLITWKEQGFISGGQEDIKLCYLLVNKLTKNAIADDVFLTILKAGELIVPVINLYDWEKTLYDEQRLIRDFYYLGEYKKVITALQLHKDPQRIDYNRNQVLIGLIFLPFDLEHFIALPLIIQYHAFACWFNKLRNKGACNKYAISLLELAQKHNPDSPLLLNLLAEQYLLGGDIEQSKMLLSATMDHCHTLQLKGAFALCNGQVSESNKLFSLAMIEKNKFGRKKVQYLDGIYGVFHQITMHILANQGDTEIFDTAKCHLQAHCQDKKNPEPSHYFAEFFLTLIDSLANAKTYTPQYENFAFLFERHRFYAHLLQYLDSLAMAWMGQLTKASLALIEAQRFFKNSNTLLFVELISQLPINNLLKPGKDEHILLKLPSAYQKKHDWDLALEKLIALSPKRCHNETGRHNQIRRLIWELKITPFNVSLSAREQKKVRDSWTKGQPISLQRLHEKPQQFDYLNEQDLKLCGQIQNTSLWKNNNDKSYKLEGLMAVKAACGAQNLFILDELSTPIELIEKAPELLITEQGNHLILSIANAPTQHPESTVNYSLVEVKPKLFYLTEFTNQHLNVLEIIGETGLTIPIAAKNKVLTSVNAVAPLLNIQSDIPELDTGLETVVAKSDLIINIQPFYDGLEFSCFSMPFGDKGPAFIPGVGNAKLTTELNGQRIATTRNLIFEQELLDKLDIQCPAFVNMANNRLKLDDPHAALLVLEQLEATTKLETPPIPIVLRWPKGKKLTLSKKLEAHHLQLAMTQKKHWFNITGELIVDDEKILTFKQLLELSNAASSRFVELDNQQILVLSEDLKQRLDTLNTATEAGEFHALAGVHVTQAVSGMRMKTLHAWDAQQVKMTQANNLIVSLPNDLHATLRDYQVSGFDWASRLAHWGAGACLADDMGLGKTIQALAMILSRTNQGPTLIIAPTSVCFNWQQEANKFAPTLKTYILSDTKPFERIHLVHQLASYDCLIISYGMLQKEAKLLNERSWTTIVADEAQALKNPLAKRTIAACSLQGDFKLITTGTPIENNLTELWSLFRFINPGLLGNLKSFSRRFSAPIENSKDDPIRAQKARKQLKRLIKPFILRRMKHQVLAELPARTDINVSIKLNEQEAQLYEALRQTAIDNIAISSANDQPGTQRIKMLSELIKLRQVCCHPSLVLQQHSIESSKLKALDGLLNELLENKHKVLVFSQFVGHLKLIKNHLEKRHIQFQYLEGSTSNKERQARVNAFQNGHGDVFLISLKAGGSGLNLTAADYVVHMDPWWNPAVEEQASDRAHRIGQQRPVTIYRLIAKDTIEEKIVSLHKHKRDLAENLLTGNEEATRLSIADMMSMLKETF